MKIIKVTIAGLALTAAAVNAEEKQMSDAEIAHELANPNTSLGSLNFPIDYTSYKGDLQGADSQESWRVTFQPILPYNIGEGMNLFFRPAFPMVYKQPVPHVRGGDIGVADSGLPGTEDQNFDDSDWELGDISFDLSVGKTFPSKWVVVGGMSGSLDTASDDDIGLGQTLLGPELAVAKITDWGVLGVLAYHNWDVAGDDDFDTSITGGQYFYTYNLSAGWQIQSQPIFSYNHEAKNGEEKWTLPLGVGIAKTTRIGKLPWKFSLQYWHYVKQADELGPDFQIRFQLGPVVPLPW